MLHREKSGNPVWADSIFFLETEALLAEPWLQILPAECTHVKSSY
jgi:hypothetical protein